MLPRDPHPNGTKHNSPGNEESFQVRPSELSNNHQRGNEQIDQSATVVTHGYESYSDCLKLAA